LLSLCSSGFSRPTSPQSDSEILRFNQDATAQTHLTGDRLLLLDDVQWKWGELPETTSHKPTVRKHVLSPVTINSSAAEHLPSVVDMGSPEYGPGLAITGDAEQHSEQTVVDLVDCEQGLAESKLETSGVDTATASASNGVDGRITEPLPEAKKGELINCNIGFSIQ